MNETQVYFLAGDFTDLTDAEILEIFFGQQSFDLWVEMMENSPEAESHMEVT